MLLVKLFVIYKNLGCIVLKMLISNFNLAEF